MDTRQVIALRLMQLCDQHNISINYLATSAGIPRSTLKNILYGRSQNPGVVTLKKLCDGLGITLGEFFSTPEFDALEQEIR